MDKIEWCLSKDHGIELVEPNKNTSELYMLKSLESLRALGQVDVKSWKITTAYYAMYFALYAVMMYIGVKCEIHDCSIEFMKRFLMSHYDDKDLQLISAARDAREDLQYYVDRKVSDEEFNGIISETEGFIFKSRDIVSILSPDEISRIRLNLQRFQYRQG